MESSLKLLLLVSISFFACKREAIFFFDKDVPFNISDRQNSEKIKQIQEGCYCYEVYKGLVYSDDSLYSYLWYVNKHDSAKLESIACLYFIDDARVIYSHEFFDKSFVDDPVIYTTENLSSDKISKKIDPKLVFPISNLHNKYNITGNYSIRFHTGFYKVSGNQLKIKWREPQVPKNKNFFKPVKLEFEILPDNSLKFLVLERYDYRNNLKIDNSLKGFELSDFGKQLTRLWWKGSHIEKVKRSELESKYNPPKKTYKAGKDMFAIDVVYFFKQNYNRLKFSLSNGICFDSINYLKISGDKYKVQYWYNRQVIDSTVFLTGEEDPLYWSIQDNTEYR